MGSENLARWLLCEPPVAVQLKSARQLLKLNLLKLVLGVINETIPMSATQLDGTCVRPY